MRRVLFFGKSMSRSRCTGALVEALREHRLEVRWVNMATLRRWLGAPGALARAARIYRSFRPDLIFVFFRDLPITLLEEFSRETPAVLWFEEPLANLDQAMIDYLRLGHLVCMSNPGRFPYLREHGLGNMSFVMSGFSPTFHRADRPRPKKRDVAFIGGPGADAARAELLDRISRRFHTEVFGARWEPWGARFPKLRLRGPVKPKGFRRVCASSRIVIGVNQVNEDPLYFSNRTFLTLASAAFHLTHYVPGLERVFRRGEHLDWFEGTDECVDKIEYYLQRKDERERIAGRGHTLVLEKHRYFNRVAEILDQLRRGVTAPCPISIPREVRDRASRPGRLAPSPVTE